jgi:NOL1/NOP2/fmu family ribosome biogenesis protein
MGDMMENLLVLNSKERKNIFSLLKKQFDSDFGEDYEFFINPRNRLFIISKDFSKIDVKQLRVNSLGLYLGELYNNELRLSVDGSQLIGKTANKKVLEVDEQAERWMKGEDFEIDSDLQGFVIVKNNSDILGCGKIAGRKLYNYVPKERRV